MKSLFGLVFVAFVIQGARRPPAVAESITVSCVPTERMPIAGLHRHPPEPMPVAKPDSMWRSSMPRIKLIPCYLADSLRVDPHSLDALPFPPRHR